MPFTRWLGDSFSSRIGGTPAAEGVGEAEGDAVEVAVGVGELSGWSFVSLCAEICSSNFHCPSSFTRLQTIPKRGVPVDLVQWIRERTSQKKTEMFMRHRGVSLIVATGGVNMVKAAYSSGTPAIGVGPRNAPAWVCADADPDEAARLVVESKSFDYGVVCGSEHQLVVDAMAREPFLAALQTYGAAVLTPEEVSRFTERAFDPKIGHLRREFVGQSAGHIARATGVEQHEPSTPA